MEPFAVQFPPQNTYSACLGTTYPGFPYAFLAHSPGSFSIELLMLEFMKANSQALFSLCFLW